MIEATEYFAGLFANTFQPVLVFGSQNVLCYGNPAATAMLKLWGDAAPSAVLTPSVLREAAYCLAETRGSTLSEELYGRPLELQLIPMAYQDQNYLVLQVCHSFQGPEAEHWMKVLHNSCGKLAGYLNHVYAAVPALGADSQSGRDVDRNVRKSMRMMNHLQLWYGSAERYQYRAPVAMDVFMEGFARAAREICPDLRLVNSIAPGNLCARAMPEDLETVLGILLSNAVRFGGNNVTVMALDAGDRIYVEILDEGEGVADEAQLFTPGYRTPDIKGTLGLGFSLPLAKKMINAQGGDLVYLRQNGKTCFRLILQKEKEQLPVLAEWDFEMENKLSQLRVELSDI